MHQLPSHQRLRHFRQKGRGNFKHASLEMSERAKNCPDLCVFMVYITFFGRLILATLYNSERSLLLSNFGSTTVS